MSKSPKSYIYEIKLPEKSMQEAKYFANQWNEELDLCIERTLKSGLIARKQIKEKLRNELYKVLEELEGDSYE